MTLLLAGLALVRAPAVRADEPGAFDQTNLVSNRTDQGARSQDPNLVNPWGISHGPQTPWWVSDNNAGVATVYDGNGAMVRKPVNIPTPTASTGGAPTGNVFNGTSNDFRGSVFIFATEDGTIAGWNPAVSQDQAFIVVDHSNVPDIEHGAVYKGLALAQTRSGQRLYAANFRAGTVDVFDTKFEQVNRWGAFTDERIKTGFAPFGIQAIGDRIYVTYAKQNDQKHDDVKGPGNGFVDVFTTEGKLLKRLVRQGQLNSPWGLALAPNGFGPFGGDLLVGNFGDGRINAYEPGSGEFEGTLRKRGGDALAIDGLWGIAFGNGGRAGPERTLFFAAGINDEKDGLFGSLQAVGESDL